MRKRELEFGLFFTKIDAPDIHYQQLQAIPLVAVCSARFRPKELPEGYITSMQGSYKRNPAQDVLDALGKTSQIQFETNSQELQKRLCLAGAGIAVLARFMVEEELSKKKLIEIAPKKPRFSQMLLARRKNHVYTLGAQKFLEMLHQK